MHVPQPARDLLHIVQRQEQRGPFAALGGQGIEGLLHAHDDPENEMQLGRKEMVRRPLARLAVLQDHRTLRFKRPPPVHLRRAVAVAFGHLNVERAAALQPRRVVVRAQLVVGAHRTQDRVVGGPHVLRRVPRARIIMPPLVSVAREDAGGGGVRIGQKHALVFVEERLRERVHLVLLHGCGREQRARGGGAFL